ncbi:PhnD/SsuA/transferrin family substrate-binding protein [Maridesulfovibrio zosterae]|uniref:PhnD/SsuA/transferrin family substrate-binding protein n=1 Tax=Maridesulfovibrio zosterae TaxID=82171 RepID=UPI000411676A|nr:PhnD/SsuA/transferrin family substrate-binding protein [Maridesulfovibrio zosterae]
MFKKVFSILLVFALSMATSVSAKGRYDFVIIQPGQPGTTVEAQPVMDSLAKYLSAKLGCEVSGVYFNELDQALKYLDKNKPAWGITGLTFFKSYDAKFKMHPVASTMPQGLDKDVWRLIIPKDGPATVNEIKGTVYGSMLYTPEAGKILSGNNEKLNFPLEGTHAALRMLRKVNKGRIAGVCLDATQYSVIKDSNRYANTKVIFESAKLPNSPVVWFGDTTDDALRLQAVLLDMKKDPAAADLLKLLQTDGFNPADGGLE